MESIFFAADRRLRNGWWMVTFIVFLALTAFVYRPVSRGLQELGIAKGWLEPLPFLFSLLATWACTRLRREPLSTVGFALDRRWLAEITCGTLLGAGAMGSIAALIWAIGGVQFELGSSPSPLALGYGLYVFLFVALLEENLFRGFLFQRFVDGAGVWIAQLVMALAFAAAHWGNPGMDGTTMIWATVDTALGALMLGLAYLRTRSLALPIGLHFGWNFAQGSVLGFDVSGFGQVGWLQPVLQGQPEWLTGGGFGPEASVFAVVADLVLITLLWRWKGQVDSDSSRQGVWYARRGTAERERSGSGGARDLHPAPEP